MAISWHNKKFQHCVVGFLLNVIDKNSADVFKEGKSNLIQASSSVAKY